MALRRQHLILFSKPLSYLGPPLVVPVNTVAPVISGRNIEGYVLTATPGTWTDAATVTGQWYRAGVAISGATFLTYQNVLADVGSIITYVETGTSVDALTDTATSNSLAATISGVILRVANRLTAADMSAWALSTYSVAADAYPTTRGGYTFGWIGTVSHATNNGGAALPVQGQASVSGTSGRYQYSTGGITEEVRVKLAVGGSSAGRTESFSIRNGDTATVLTFKADTVMAAASDLLVGDGTVKTLTTYDQDVGVLVTPTSGSIVVRRNGAAGYMDLRFVEITYPGYSVVTFGTGPFYTSTSGSDAANGTTTGTPWAHIAGDEGASTPVSVFNVLADGSNLLNKGQRHRSPTFGARTTHFKPRGAGTSGHLVTYGAYGSGADPVIDGSEVQPSWSAAASGDVYANPNLANIVKKTVTGVTAYQTTIFEGDTYHAPAQWPSPSNPYDFGRSYNGTDAFKSLTEAEWAAGVTQGANNSHSTGYKSCTIQHADLLAHYGSIDIKDYVVVVFMNGSRLNEYVIDNYDTPTGRIDFHIANAENLHGALDTPPGSNTDSSGLFLFAVRYCPFDIRKAGQYGYDKAKTVAMFHPFGSAERSISRLTYGMALDKSYLKLENMRFERFGTASGGAMVTTTGVAVSGFQINNLKLRQIFNTSGNMVMYFTDTVEDFAFTNIDIADCPRNGGLTMTKASNGTIDGFRMRHEGRSSLYFAGLGETVAANNITVTDLDVCDQDNVHGNGLVIYQDANHITTDGFLGMNRPRGVSVQPHSVSGQPLEDYVLASRGNVIRNFVITTKNAHPDAVPTGAANYAWQGAYGETGGLVEIGISGDMLMHPSVGLPASTGMIMRNLVISSLLVAELPGVIMENCLIFNEKGSGKTSLPSGATDANPGSVVFAPTDSFDGTITVAMQQALTRNTGGSGYTTRTLGTTANPWVIPAYGDTFTLIDLNTTTTELKIGQRAGDTFTSVLNSRPGSTIALPAGVTDNDDFTMTKGQIAPVANLTAGTYSVTVRETNVTGSNTGATTHDTVFTFTVA